MLKNLFKTLFIDATFAPCSCNEKYYNTLVNCVTCLNFNSSVDISVMSPEQYKKTCKEDLLVSFGKETSPLLYVLNQLNLTN